MMIPVQHKPSFPSNYIHARCTHTHRPELLLLLLIQHMLEAWPVLDRNSSNVGSDTRPPSHTTYSKPNSQPPDQAAQQQLLQVRLVRLVLWRVL